MVRLANAQKGGSVFVGAISDLNVTAFDDTTITLDWTTPTADNPLDYFEVYLDGVFYENTTDASEGWVITGLTAGTSYDITLKTVDDVGNKSGFSNEVVQATSGGISPIYDGVSAMYTLRRPAMTTLWTNAVLKIRRSSDNTTAFVFFDGSAVNDTLSTSSFISTSSDTTPDATTLGTWLGANDAFVETWIAITDNNTIDTGKRGIQTNTTLQPKFATAGVINLKNGTPAILFDGVNDFLQASANTDLASANTFTTMIVCNTTDTNYLGCALNTSETVTTGLGFFLDSRTNRFMGFVIAGTNCDILFISQQNNTNQKLQAYLNTSGTIAGYLNGTFQDSDTYTGSYINNAVMIGKRYTTLQQFKGNIQEIILFPSDKTSDFTTLNNDIDTHYSIP